MTAITDFGDTSMMPAMVSARRPAKHQAGRDRCCLVSCPMNWGRLYFGLIVVAVGVLLLLDQAGVLDAGEIFGTWWPVVLVAAGMIGESTGIAEMSGAVAGACGSDFACGCTDVFAGSPMSRGPVATVVLAGSSGQTGSSVVNAGMARTSRIAISQTKCRCAAES